MKKALVVLEITYDEHQYDHPQDWSWHLLCDLPNRDDVKVLPKLPHPDYD